MWPRIVAEALDVPTTPPPLRGSVATCDEAQWRESIAQAWAPLEHEGRPPEWLRPHQVTPWRRSVAALRHYGGVVLAEPVGAGKTWIALATIAASGGRGTVVAPAVLLPQWQAAAATLRLRVTWHSLERCSRGVPPPNLPGVAVIDEAHRLRNLGTRRALTLADWLPRRPAMLLTATPIVNRRTDLLDLLHLVVGDDALRGDGIASLHALARTDIPHPALRRLVIRTAPEGGGTPLATRRFRLSPAERARARRAARGIVELELASAPGVQRLLRGVLADAAASSDAAWQAALRRSEALVRQAKEGGGLSREVLRRFAGDACDQGVLWELVAPEAHAKPVLVPIADLPRLAALRALPRADAPWLADLEQLLHDQTVTVVFCRHRATAHLVRRHLGDAVAWITGQEAGLGPHRLPRQVVLAAFGPRRTEWSARRIVPRVLIATDVAAEGLDLQAASRVVHLDLPWTAMRRDQRNGRLRRPGQTASVVEVVERHPAPSLERLLRLGQRIRAKATIADRWLAALEHGCALFDFRSQTRISPESVERLWLVGVERDAVSTGTILVASRGDAAWVPSAGDVGRLLARIPGSPAVEPEGLRHQVLAAVQATIAVPSQYPALTARIHRLARIAGHQRNTSGLIALDRLLVHLREPGPLGLRRELDRLRHAPDADLLGNQLPPRAPTSRPTARILASTVVSDGRSRLRSRHDPLLDRVVRPRRDPD